jgi:beta-glucosidase
VTVPRHAGQLPVYYNYKRSKGYWLKQGWGRAYVDMAPAPLYPFGFGLGYAAFEYSGLRLSAREISTSHELEIQLQVKNKSGRAGTETVQLYIEDRVSSVATPVKQLRGFAKLAIDPGETKTCTFRLTSDDLALYDKDLRRVVEPGQFRVMVGASSEDIRLSDVFEVK